MIDCVQSGKCFARENGKCTILTGEMKKGCCSFQKPKVNVTNGKRYKYVGKYEK